MFAGAARRAFSLLLLVSVLNTVSAELGAAKAWAQDGAIPAKSDPEEPQLYAGKPVSFWIAELADRTTRKIAVDVLVRAGGPVFHDVVRALTHSNPEIRQGAADVLPKLKPDDVDPLPALPYAVAALSDADASVRLAGARVIGIIGPRGHRAITRLTPLLRDRNGIVRGTAIWAIGKMGEKALGVLDLLERSLDDRTDAAETLRAFESLGPAARSVLPRLLRRTESDQFFGDVDLLKALVSVAPTDARVVAELRRCRKLDGVRSKRTTAILIAKAWEAGAPIGDLVVQLLAGGHAQEFDIAERALLANPKLAAAESAAVIQAFDNSPKALVERYLRLMDKMTLDRAAVVHSLLKRFRRNARDHEIANALRKWGSANHELLVREVETGDDTVANGVARVLRSLFGGDLTRYKERFAVVVRDATRPRDARVVLFSLLTGPDEPWDGGKLIGEWLLSADPVLRKTAKAHAHPPRSDVAPTLLLALEEGTPDEQVRALAWCSGYGEFDGIETAARELLRSKNAAARAAAREGLLGQLNRGTSAAPQARAEDLLPSLLTLMRSDAAAERRKGFQGLSSLNALALPALPDLVKGFDDDDATVRKWAFIAGSRIARLHPDEVFAVVEPALTSGSPRARLAALSVAAACGAERVDMAAHVRALLERPDELEFKREVLGRFFHEVPWASSLTDLWIELSDHKDPAICHRAVLFLAHVTPITDAAWKVLTRIEADPTHRGRGNAMLAYVRAGKRGIDALSKLLSSKDRDRRRSALLQLCAHRDVLTPTLEKRIRAIADDEADPLRWDAQAQIRRWE